MFNARATCVGGTVGVMKSGVPIYSAFDATGRDAVANEVQDRCGGHPQRSGQYHYHAVSVCLHDSGRSSRHSSLVGWALDGSGIYGRRPSAADRRGGGGGAPELLPPGGAKPRARRPAAGISAGAPELLPPGGVKPRARRPGLEPPPSMPAVRRRRASRPQSARPSAR